MLLAIISGIVTDDALVSYWLIFFLVPCNSPSPIAPVIARSRVQTPLKF